MNLIKNSPDTLKAGDEIKFGDVILKVLWPLSNNPSISNESSVNDNSIVIKMTYHNISLLLTGDCESLCEQNLIQRYNLESTILKAGHHGISNSSSLDFLERVNPEIIIIPRLINSSFIKPNVLNCLGGELNYSISESIIDFKKARILDTRDNGTIKITTNGERYRFDFEKQEFRYCINDTLINSLELMKIQDYDPYIYFKFPIHEKEYGE